MYRKLMTAITLLALLTVALPVSAKSDPSPLLASGVVGSGTPQSCTDAALRSAIAKYSSITFNCGASPVTIYITGGELVISSTKSINGGGKITLDAQGRSRVFRVGYGINAAFYNMTIKNGKGVPKAGDTVRTGFGQGGGIFADTLSNITVSRVTFINNISLANADCNGGGAIALARYNHANIFGSVFTGNKAMEGGAIKSFASELTVNSSLFDSNEANYDHAIVHTGLRCVGGGGAILIDGADPIEQGGTLTIKINNSVFRNNKTGYSGGGIFAYLYKSATMTIDHSTFENNRAIMFRNSDGSFPTDQGKGGGMWLGGKEGTDLFTGKFIVRNSTINNNHADYGGGGVLVASATMLMGNSTVASNEARNSFSVPLSYYRGYGGGIALAEGTVVPVKTRLTNITVTGNNAGLTGGGIYGSHGGGTTTPLVSRLENSIVANNVANGAAQNCHVPLVNGGGNIQYPAHVSGTRGSNCTSGITIANPNLGSLNKYGGPTKTVPLLAGSPAINRAVASYCSTTDQRGYKRSGACDSGAFEYGGVAPAAASADQLQADPIFGADEQQ